MVAFICVFYAFIVLVATFKARLFTRLCTRPFVMVASDVNEGTFAF
jgi:hypothetical protein